MAIALTELIKNPSKLDEIRPPQGKCAYCGVLLQETITGNRPTPEGPACSDCYFEHIGAGIEQDPIVSGKIRRG